MAPSFKTLASDGTDIHSGNWIDCWLSAPARPYARLMRLDRPIGTWLLLFPCWWGLALAWEGWHDLGCFVLFGLGAMVMRGAGCTLNDIIDREFDGRVARTRDAADPERRGQRARRPSLFLALQLASARRSCCELRTLRDRAGLRVAAPDRAPIRFMKRITYWPQFFLGLNFNWGALLGWAAVTRRARRPAPAALCRRHLPGRSATTPSTPIRTRRTTSSSA